MIWLDLIEDGAWEEDWWEFEWDGGLDRRHPPALQSRAAVRRGSRGKRKRAIRRKA